MGLMGLMGPIGLMELMGLMGLIGFMGAVGAIGKLARCGVSEDVAIGECLALLLGSGYEGGSKDGTAAKVEEIVGRRYLFRSSHLFKEPAPCPFFLVDWFLVVDFLLR